MALSGRYAVKDRVLVCLAGDKRQGRREAAGGEGDGSIPSAQLFGGIAEGSHEPGVGLVERLARCLGRGMHPRCRRAGELFGPVQRIPSQDRFDSQNLGPRLLSHGGGFGFNVLSQGSDALTVGFVRKMSPAGNLGEDAPHAIDSLASLRAGVVECSAGSPPAPGRSEPL